MILETLQTLPHVQVIYADEEKIFCSVRVTVKRDEQINSGSMMFTHPRYITFGQLVVISDKDVGQDQAGALFLKTEDALEALNNIADYVPREKEEPDNCIVIG